DYDAHTPRHPQASRLEQAHLRPDGGLWSLRAAAGRRWRVLLGEARPCRRPQARGFLKSTARRGFIIGRGSHPRPIGFERVDLKEWLNLKRPKSSPSAPSGGAMAVS